MLGTMLAGMTYLCFNLELFYVYVATSAECHHFTQAKTNLCAKVSEVVESVLDSIKHCRNIWEREQSIFVSSHARMHARTHRSVRLNH